LEALICRGEPPEGAELCAEGHFVRADLMIEYRITPRRETNERRLYFSDRGRLDGRIKRRALGDGHDLKRRDAGIKERARERLIDEIDIGRMVHMIEGIHLDEVHLDIGFEASAAIDRLEIG